ncbi:MAG: gliding motility-associated C-terminal domain-containing protein, partial [Odoribacter sp.]|nr:gliding motility-associated C-terminal domain-containing protein [Odoribacter sp.]
LAMFDGIIPDQNPGNRIDGWFCRGQKISLKALITSEEGEAIESPRYKWMIDGLDFVEEHPELADKLDKDGADSILTWIPGVGEDDIVVKVTAYCDRACEEVTTSYLRLKAREFDDVSLKIMTSRDSKHRFGDTVHFCTGDTINFWLATRSAGKTPQYQWQNDIFKLPNGQSPKNELIRYDSANIVMVMGQDDSWMLVEMTPSPEICLQEPVVTDTVFMKKMPWMEPELHIDCSDTLVCRGDSVSMLAIHANAGSKPTFQWQRSIGEPFPDWNLGTEHFATVFVDEDDVWVKCTMTPSEDVCYDESESFVDAVKIVVFKDSSEVLISCDIEDKLPGEEVVFEAEVRNLLGEPRYEWYVNEMKSPCTEAEYITSSVNQGDVVYCLVSGDKNCQTRIKSNEIIVDYGHINRDTMIVIYKNERVKDLNMVKEGDDLAVVLFKLETPAKYGVGTISTDGQFNYTPIAGFTGTDEVKYVVVNRRDKSVVAEGYIYVTVKENDRFFVPNLITPNGDGINDTWQLDFLSEYPNHLIQVFDRSGRIVFEARNYQNDWDGKGMTKSGYVGQVNLVNGVYTYMIDLGDKNKTVLKSWIEIRANLNRRNYR